MFSTLKISAILAESGFGYLKIYQESFLAHGILCSVDEVSRS